MAEQEYYDSNSRFIKIEEDSSLWFFFTGLLLGKLESLELKIQAKEREREREKKLICQAGHAFVRVGPCCFCSGLVQDSAHALLFSQSPLLLERGSAGGAGARPNSFSLSAPLKMGAKLGGALSQN